jgi:hypothetical protein
MKDFTTQPIQAAPNMVFLMDGETEVANADDVPTTSMILRSYVRMDILPARLQKEIRNFIQTQKVEK